MGTTLSGFDHYRHASIPTWYYQTTNYCGTSGENPPDAFVLAFDGQQVRKWASSIGSGNSNFTTADHPWEGEFSSALCIQNDELVIAGYSGNDHGTGAGDFPFRLPTPQPQPTGNTFYSEGLLTNASAIVYNLDGFITRFDVSGLTSRFTEKEFQLNPYILYPNPSQNSFSLLLPESVSSCNVSIFDISGRLLMAELKFIKGSTPIKTDHLSHGVYFVKITDSFSTQTLKLIKE